MTTSDKKYDYVYRFIEFKDEMTKAIENVKTVIAQSEKLNSILEKNNEDKTFDSFLTANKTQIENYNSQIAILEKKIEKIDELINLCNNNDIAKFATTLLVESFGIFRQTDEQIKKA